MRYLVCIVDNISPKDEGVFLLLPHKQGVVDHLVSQMPVECNREGIWPTKNPCHIILKGSLPE